MGNESLLVAPASGQLNFSQPGALDSALAAEDLPSGNLAITVSFAVAGGLAFYALLMLLAVRLCRRGTCVARREPLAAKAVTVEQARAKAGDGSPPSSSSPSGSECGENEVVLAIEQTPLPQAQRNSRQPSRTTSTTKAMASEWLARQEMRDLPESFAGLPGLPPLNYTPNSSFREGYVSPTGTSNSGGATPNSGAERARAHNDSLNI